MVSRLVIIQRENITKGLRNLYIIHSYKTSIVPILSKGIELGGAPSTGVRQTHSIRTMRSSSTNDQMEWKLRKDKPIWKDEI